MPTKFCFSRDKVNVWDDVYDDLYSIKGINTRQTIDEDGNTSLVEDDMGTGDYTQTRKAFAFSYNNSKPA